MLHPHARWLKRERSVRHHALTLLMHSSMQDANWHYVSMETSIQHVCRYVPALAAIFGVTALSWAEWRAVLWLSAPVVLTDEVLKAVSRQLEQPGGLATVTWLPRSWGRYAVSLHSTEKQRH
jgi:hypothetical protein